MRRKRPAFQFERLEDRICLTVSATVTNGHLVITGEPDGAVQINAVAANTFQVVDNGVVVATLGGVTRNIRLSIDQTGPRSNDAVTLNLNGLATPLSVRLDAGDGNNTFTITNGTVTRTLIVIGGTGADTVTIGPAVTIGRHFVARTFGGNDSVTIQGQVTGRTVYRAGAGNDMFLLDDQGTLSGRANIYGQRGSDTATMLGMATTAMLLEMSGGNDVVSFGQFFDTTGTVQVGTGPGSDSVSLDGTFGNTVTVATGNGNDALTFLGRFTATTSADGGRGDDTFSTDPLSAFEGDLSLTGGRDDDQFTVSGYFYSDFFVDGQAGTDRIDLLDDAYFEADATVRGGSGADTVVSSASVDGLFTVNGGLGLDALTLLDGVFGSFLSLGFDETHGGVITLDANQQELLESIVLGDQLVPADDSLLIIAGQPTAAQTTVRTADGTVFTVDLTDLADVLSDDTLAELVSVNEGASVVITEDEVFALAELAVAAVIEPLTGDLDPSLPGSPVDRLGGADLQDLARAQIIFGINRQRIMNNVRPGFSLASLGQSTLINVINRIRLGAPGGLMI